MTTELIILLSLAMFIIVGAFKSPPTAFKDSGPRLGARIETQIETAPNFTDLSQSKGLADPVSWKK